MAIEAPPVETSGDRAQAPTSDDPRQALRIRRYLMGVGASLLAIAALFIAHRFGLLPWSAALEGTTMIVALAVMFYLLLRFGVNRQFSDPSLTTEMIVCAVVVLAYLMYQAPEARNALSLFYLAAMLFGVLRLSGSNRQLKIAFERIEQVAIHDELTGMFNRRFTATIGIAASRPGEDIEMPLGRADTARYEGKAAGRNRVVAVG